MYQITAVEPRRKRWRALFLDGEFAVKIDEQVWAQCSYQIGMSISDEQLQELIQNSERYRAKEKALYLLTHRDHTKKELVEKLKRTSGEEVAREAAQRMEEIGLVNEEAYARRYAKELMCRKKFAPSRTEYELEKKGIDRELIHEIIEEIGIDPADQLRDLLERKYAQAVREEKGRRRTVASLQRLGYRWEDIRRALEEFTPSVGGEDDSETWHIE